MNVRFHNLAARAPQMADLGAVTELMIACDTLESRIAEPTMEDVSRAWESADFCLDKDAWVIVSNQGKLVGYADVRRERRGNIEAVMRVHPDFRGRGIGTLLIWMIEDRARQVVRGRDDGERIVLELTVSSLDRAGRELLEREGYSLARHFWRLVIDIDEVSRTALEGQEESRKLKLDLVIDVGSLLGEAANYHRTGMYVAHQYNVYEKVLCEGRKNDAEVVLEQHMLRV